MAKTQNKNNNKQITLQSLPAKLRGLPQNRWGGYRNVRLRTYGGEKGAAGPCIRYGPEDRQDLVKELLAKGIVTEIAPTKEKK